MLILLLAYASPAVFSVFLAVVLLLSLAEFNRMGLADTHRPAQWAGALIGTGVVPLFLFDQQILLLPFLTAAVLILALYYLFYFKSIEVVRYRLGWQALGLLYVPLLLGHTVPLFALPTGRRWIFLTLLAIMCCDTFAYLFGRKIGRHKLYPAVSPNKSVEGAVAGLAGAVVGVLLAGWSFLPAVGIMDGLLIGVVLGVMGQLGDLFESLLKRTCDIKDSGALIPGHGGLLDRLDSLLFAFPVVYYIARYGYGG